MRKLEQHTKAIAKKLNTLGGMTSHSKHELFNHFIQVVFNMTANPSYVTVAHPFSFLHVKEGWRVQLPSYAVNESAWNLLGEIGSEYLEAVKAAPPFTDVIGPIVSEYSERTLGQFLTPSHVAKNVAQLAMAFMPPITSPIGIGDPTGCGAGSLILAQLQHIYDHQGSDGLALTNAVVTDIDVNMVRACCMQIMMSSIIHKLPLHSLTARHGNAITAVDEEHVVYRFMSLNACVGLSSQKVADITPTIASEPAVLAAAPAPLSPQGSITARDELFERVMGRKAA